MADESYIDRRTRELNDREPQVPLRYEDLREAARNALPGTAFDYAAGAAGDEGTLEANQEAFAQYRIVPRVLRDVTDRSLTTEVFGRELAAPVGLTPVGGQNKYHPEAELAPARAAAELGLPFTLATGATHSIEELAEGAGSGPRFFQLYWPEDWDIAGSFVSRAEEAGYDAIVLTLDSQLDKWRTRNLANRYHHQRATSNRLFVTDPVVAEKADEKGVSVEEYVESRSFGKDASLTWEDVSFLREHTDLPIVFKGILHPDDARLALEHGADAVQVSTHGGRQIDGEQAALEALPEVVDAVDGEVPVFFDSGIRGGDDVFKALALGADLALVGRPFVFGLAVAGQRGVHEVLLNILAELDSIVGLTGHADVTDVGRDALAARHAPR